MSARRPRSWFMPAVTIARREIRAGTRGFRIFMACLFLGVAAIAAVGSIASSVEEGLRRDARTLLGGDIDLRLTHRPADNAQQEWLAAHAASVSTAVMTRAMAIRTDGTDRRLIELKAVDGNYPLYGGFELTGGGKLQDAMKAQGNVPSAVVDPALLERLALKTGDEIRIGDARFKITATITKEPDRSTEAFELGPRVFVTLDGLERTGLIQPGSIVRYHYRVKLPPGTDANAWEGKLNAEFPEAGWRIRNFDNAAPNIQRYIDRVSMFLTLVGLTALLVGGVGVGNAVRAFLTGKLDTIATLKCVGAEGRTIMAIYMMQVFAMATLAILAGLTAGALAPYLALVLLGKTLPIAVAPGIFFKPLAIAAAFGFLVTFVFAVIPLSQARATKAATLFRSTAVDLQEKAGKGAFLMAGAGLLLLAGLAVAFAAEPRLASGFVIGAAATLILFRLSAGLIVRLARQVPRPKHPLTRIALSNLHRAGSATTAIILSLGLGLTVLSAVALIQANLARQVTQTIRDEAPGFYFIDIQPDQIGPFLEKAGSYPTVTRVEDVPMLRGRITKLAGTPVEEIKPPPDFAWILRGDRGLTWSRKPPGGEKVIVEGKWWPADYAGAPLVSFDAEAARAFGLKIGDTITVNVLGRDIDATISNLRQIDWTTLGINFVMVFSPGLLEKAPQSYIATAYLDPSRETGLERTITDSFPNVSAIRVKEVLEDVNRILGHLATAVQSVAAFAILAGILVLAGAMAAGHQRRVYESVILKVVGARRWDVTRSHLIEYGFIGAVTVVLSAIAGTVISWAVITFPMKSEWIFVPSALLATVLTAAAVTLVAGLAGSWAALGRKAAPYLRNE